MRLRRQTTTLCSRRLSILNSGLTFRAQIVTDCSTAEGVPSTAAQCLQISQQPFIHLGQCEGLARMQEEN